MEPLRERGGIFRSQWWMPAGWKARTTHGWTAPRFWSDTSWVGNQANRPAVGVSWYEAVAYGRWLSSQLEYNIRLCSEAEWEKAARERETRGIPTANTWMRKPCTRVGAIVSTTRLHPSVVTPGASARGA